jgi:hypothetical protein
MPVKVSCPKCGKELSVPQQLHGKRVACPSCNAGFRISTSPESQRTTPPPVASRVMPPPVDRPVQTAKFVAGEAAETRVQLGADGRLPELVVPERNTEREQEQTGPRESKPLLLIGVLCFSITLSIIMLVFEPSQHNSRSFDKAEARRVIAAYYTGVGPDLKPFQKKLREALQAYHREDFDTERRLYRQVLNMLHDESNPDVDGLTGWRVADGPPNDLHLEQQLAKLMSRD